VNDLARLESLLADALVAADPAGELRRGAGTLPPELRAAVAAADPDGVRMTALLVARLRFERLVQGSREAGAWFDRDPKGFTEEFRRYHRAVPPTAHDPAGEAELFSRWTRAPGA